MKQVRQLSLVLILATANLVFADTEQSVAAPDANAASEINDAGARDPSTRWSSRVVEPTESRLASYSWDSGRGSLRRVLGRTLLICSGLVVAALIIVMLGKRRGGTGQRLRNDTVEMDLVGTLTLAPRCYLQLVAINQQHFLVARDGTTVRCMRAVGSFADSLDPLVSVTSNEPTHVPLGDPLPLPEAAAGEAKNWPSSQLASKSNRRNWMSKGLPETGLSLESGGDKGDASQVSSKRNDPWQGSLPIQR